MRQESAARTWFISIAMAAVLVGASTWPAGAQGGSDRPASVSPENYHYQEIYDDLAIASMRLRSGGFAAYVFVGGETRAVYELSVRDQTGKWRVLKDDRDVGRPPAQTVLFDYRAARVRGFDGDIRDLLAKHTVRSVGLSAVLLWEDYLEGSSPMVLEPIPELPFRFPEGGNGLPEEDDYDQCVAAGVCTITPNGCTAVPDACPPFSTQTITASCNEHDRCYQCGAACFGTSRLQCDRDLRTNISFQANSACAWTYFLGVRAAGWLFYQTAGGGIGRMHDAYSLGISISACEGQYAHMCTVYVF